MLDRLDLSAVRAVALDVDGTLAGDDAQVSERAIVAMRAVAALGIPVIVLTGRSRRNTLEIARRVGLRHTVVACNGALVIDPTTEHNLLVSPMSDDGKQAFRQLADDLALDLTWWTEHELYVSRQGPMIELLWELNRERAMVADPDTIVDSVVLKMMAMGPPSHLDAVADEIERRVPGAARSMDNPIEVVHPDSTKWHALQWVLQRYGIDPTHVLGAGDGGNDVVWLSRIGLPVAMGNARPEVLRVALAEAPSNIDDGAAALLERLIEVQEARA